MSRLSDITKATTAVYTATIPSTGKKVQFRPFCVRDERSLLSAYESDDSGVMMNTLVSVVKNCLLVQTPLTTFDIEYLFIQIRAVSVGEYSELTFRCHKCGEETPQNIDIRTCEVSGINKENIVVLSDLVTVKLRYPSIEAILEVEMATPEEILRKSIRACMDLIIYGEEVIKIDEESDEEVLKFLDGLTSTQFHQLENFVKNIPSVSLKTDWKCPHCEEQNETVIRGIYGMF